MSREMMEEIEARIDCGESFDSAMQAVICRAEEKQKYIKSFNRIAREFSMYDSDYIDERAELRAQWNELVIPAERAGITHQTMKEIWKTYNK